MMSLCQISAQTRDSTICTLRIENKLLPATILLDKGADIYELVYRPKSPDVLWKSPVVPNNH